MELKKYNANHTKVLKINQIVRTVSETHRFDKDKLIAINTSDVENGVMGSGTLTSVDELKGQFKKAIVKDDILFSEIRPTNRRFAKVTTEDTKDYVVSTKLMVLRKYNEDVDLEYFYYCLTNQPFLDILQRRAENRIGSFPQITFDLLSEYAFPIPPISEQKRISSVISTLDKKIALNRAINQNLEAVIADVMGYKFLSNAETLPKRFIGDIASIKAGGDCPQEWSKYKTKDCQIPIYSNGTENEGLYGYTKEPTILKRGITVAARGTIGYCTMRNGGYVPIIRLLAVTPNDIGGDVYLHQIFNRIKFRNDGSIQQQLTVPSLASIEIPYPNASTLKAFANITYPLIEKIKQNKIQIEELTKQRDELLPLLMNGQVSVNSDLAASYIIYKNKIIRIMKENIIQAIVAEMQRDLDCRQMARLKAVLTSELHNVEIIEKSDCATQQTQENEHLLNSFISAKKIEGCSDKTLTYYRNTIERLLVTLSLAICHITTTDIRTYLSDYQEEHQSSKVTIDNMRRIFSSFFAWLEDEDYIAKSPVRRIHKVKTDSLVKEVLSDEQLEQLRDSCTNKRDLAIIDILASTGIRVGELVKLNREDIDFHERQCVVFGKGNKERIVYFNARTKLHLQQYLNERTDDNPALFVSLHSPHTRLTISGVEIRIRKLGQSLSMPKVHPHKFRRTLATMAIDKGMPIEQVQRLLGHVRIDTTLHYAIVNQNNVKLAHKKYLG